MKEKIVQYLMRQENMTEKAAGIVCAKLVAYPDILAEAADWVDSGNLTEDGAVQVEGYTARQLCEMVPLKPIGAFGYLAYLRNNPVEALENLKKGLPRK